MAETSEDETAKLWPDADPEDIAKGAAELAQIFARVKEHSAALKSKLERERLPEDVIEAARLALFKSGQFRRADEIREDLSLPECQELIDSLIHQRNFEAAEPAAGPTTPESNPAVRTFKEWRRLLEWSATTWARRRKEFPGSFSDVPGENACSIREPELGLWMASAQNKRSPFENHK